MATRPALLLSLLLIPCLAPLPAQKGAPSRPEAPLNQGLPRRAGMKREEAPAVARAIERGLLWLRAQQQADGSFTLPGEKPRQAPYSEIEIHSLCLLSFLGDGSTLRAGPFKDPVKKAVRWLRSRGRNAAMQYDKRCLGQALAVQALAECACLSKSTLLAVDVKRGLPVLTRMQNPDGGFPAGRAGLPSDVVASLHALLALQTARMLSTVEIEVGDAEERLLTWFGKLPQQKSLQLDARYGEHRREQLAASAWLLARFLGGASPKADEWILAAAQRIQVADKGSAQRASGLEEYLRSHAAYQLGGALLREWKGRGRRSLLERQLDAGGIRSAAGARPSLWSTALGVLSLEAAFRFRSSELR